MNKAIPIFPKQKSGLFSTRLEQLCLLCYYDPAGISTVPETVAYIQFFSGFSITVLNLFEHGRNSNTISLSPQINLDKFDGIVVHNTLSYNVENLRSLDRLLDLPLRKFKGAKVLMKQDENFRFKELAEYIGETEYDLIFTCLPDQSIPAVYPESLVGTPRFSRMLTGYVTPTLRSIQTQGQPRTIDIGYRGSIQPLSFGRLAYEKRKIGEDVKHLLDGRGLRLDISSRWEDRLGADAWFNFLASSKATLGAESGASIFDLQGDLLDRCNRAEMRLGAFNDTAAYAESYLSELADLEGNVDYNQVSPRHFEAAATRTLQIMYPGRYSDIFIPGRHFISLARDYSNLDDVVELLRDDAQRNVITECAHQEIIESPKYWIETFIKGFDELVSDALTRRGVAKRPTQQLGSVKSNVILLAAHQPSLDPRLDWIAKSAPKDMRITQLGVLSPESQTPLVHLSSDGDLVLADPRIRFNSDMLASWFNSTMANEAGWAGLSEINFLAFVIGLEDNRYLELFAAPPGSDRTGAFTWYLNYILDTTATLLAMAERIRGFDAVIATDLDTLPAALIIKGLTGVPVIYDAHEYWPEADVAAFEFETQYWVAMEKRLVKHADHRQTVSPGLALFMSEQYECKFNLVPNCEPIGSLQMASSQARRTDGKCRFIFQGNFAARRGLDLLVQAWPETDEQAILLLRGPDNDYKRNLIESARKTGLLDTRIFFPDPVPESELISAARDGDVGLIPYTPAGRGYIHCCPNKTSQYMAASLPILANNTNFVKALIEEADAGMVVDFSDKNNIVSAVAHLIANPDERMAMGKRGYSYFCERFHWELVSKPMYEKIEALLTEKSAGNLQVFAAFQHNTLYQNIVKETVADPSVDTPKSLAKLRRISRILAKPLWHLLPSALRYRLGPAMRRTVKTIFKF